MIAARTDPAAPPPSYVVVIPVLGRPCLQACLNALADAHGPLPDQVVLADDRPGTPDSLLVLVPAAIADRTAIVTLERRTRGNLPIGGGRLRAVMSTQAG